MLYELSSFELRKLAYELADRNNRNYSFNNNFGVAGNDWYKDFMERLSNYLFLRKPEATSVSCAMGFNQVAVDSFFSLLEEVVGTNKLQVENIRNCDETGISSVLKCLPKIVSTKGKREVDSLSSADRGQLVTAIIVNK